MAQARRLYSTEGMFLMKKMDNISHIARYSNVKVYGIWLVHYIETQFFIEKFLL